MIARLAKTAASVAFALSVSGCTSFYQVAIETPLGPTLDVSSFQRALVAGFIAGGTDEVDVTLETFQLLRTQLRGRTPLTVADAGPLPLLEIAAESSTGGAALDGQPDAPPAAIALEPISNEKDLAAYEHVFANAAFWRQLGEEYGNPLIITGTVLFTPAIHEARLPEPDPSDASSPSSQRRVLALDNRVRHVGFALTWKLIYLDGRTGAVIYSETFREQILYEPEQRVPALASYFELMDRTLPGVLRTVSKQNVPGTRLLLK